MVILIGGGGQATLIRSIEGWMDGWMDGLDCASGGWDTVGEF